MTAVPTPDELRAPDLSTEELAAALRLSVTRLARILRQQSDADLTPTQLSALATLERRGPVPIGVLADEEQIGAPTATKTIDRLVAAGHVERHAAPADRRVTLVEVTDDGRALLAELRARKTAWLTTRLAALSEEDRRAAADAVAVLERLTAPPRSDRPNDPTDPDRSP